MTLLQRPRLPAGVRLIAGTLVILAAGLPNAVRGATLEVGTGREFPVPSAAAAVAHDGDRVVIAAGSYADCSVWKANGLTIEGAGSATVISGKVCAGKGLFIVQGDGITVRGLTLAGAHAAAFNGAGIRAEGGDLTIEHVRFTDNEDGLLAGTLPSATIVIRDSEFIGNGTCAGSGGCAHAVYVGHLRLLRVERSRFAGTRTGHHIKSRALRTEVVGCTLEDGLEGSSSLAVDISNGGAVLLRDDHIEKGPKSENRSAAVTIGAEGVTQATPEIVVEHNFFRVDGGYQAYLVDNRSATAAVLRGNVLEGGAVALRGAGSVK